MLPLPPDSASLRTSALHGARVCAVGAPFGAVSPPHFQAMALHGLLSVPLGSGVGPPPTAPSLWLSDLACLPGMEGGLVALDPHGGAPPEYPVVGMMLPPLLARGGAAEAALVAPLSHVLAAAREAGGMVGLTTPRQPNTTGLPPPPGLSSPTPAARVAARSVVAVRGAGSWASGVLVTGEGHILTVAHLLRPRGQIAGRDDGPVAVQVAWAPSPGSRQRWLPARVVHIFSGPLDMAVLQVARRDLPRHAAPAVLAGDGPGRSRQGAGVVVAGHPTFSPTASPLAGPILTTGTLGKVIPLRGAPGMLLTSASVRSGASGGALLDAASGHLLGLVTSNARHTLGVTYPRLNFAIPGALLRPTVAALERSAARGGAPDWAALDGSDAALAALWRLGKRPKEEVEQGPPVPKALKDLLEQRARDQKAPQGAAQGPGRSKL